MSNPLPPVRRIVTGHDDRGRAIIQEDGVPPRVQRFGDERATQFVEIWNTGDAPAAIDAASGEPPEDGIALAPPAGGTRIRIVDFAPDDADAEPISPEQAQAVFEAMGAAPGVLRAESAARHPFMHRTETIDYGIVLDGEITLIVDEGETTVGVGGIVIQRGTSHAWSNRSGKPCRVAFVLVDGKFDPALGF